MFVLPTNHPSLITIIMVILCMSVMIFVLIYSVLVLESHTKDSRFVLLLLIVFCDSFFSFFFLFLFITFSPFSFFLIYSTLFLSITNIFYIYLQVADYFSNQPVSFCQEIFSNMSETLNVLASGPSPSTSLPSSSSSSSCFSSLVRECTALDVTGYYSECDLRNKTKLFHPQYYEVIIYLFSHLFIN